MFINNIEVIAKRLKGEFDIQTKDIQHNLSKGMMREDSLKNALREIVPVKYEFGSGTVIDAHGIQSRQQDFLLYDAFSSPTFLKKQSSLVLPIESIYAAIEVKSTLSNQELEKAVRNFDSLMSLEKNTINSFIPITGNNSIMGLVFAYTSNSSLETLTNKLIELNESLPVNHRIGCICVLDKGNIVNVQKDDIRTLSTLSSENTTLIIKENDLEQNFYLFYLWRSVEKNAAAVLELMQNVELVIDVSKQNLGYDLEVSMVDGSKRYYEVKSVDSMGDLISVTTNEYSTGAQLRKQYYLAIAYQSDNQIDICFVSDPINKLKFDKRVTRWEWTCDRYEGEVVSTEMA